MKKRLVIIGEGPQDIGRREWFEEGDEAFKGDIPSLLDRLHELHEVRYPVPFVSITLKETQQQIASFGRSGRAGKLGRTMRDAVIRASRGEFLFDEQRVDPLAIVLLVDARRDNREEVLGAASDAERECETLGVSVPVVIGVAIHEIEAWLLADEACRIAAFGSEVGRRPLPQPPEEIGDPKALWRSLHGQVSEHEDEEGRDYWLRRRLAWLALRIDVVRARCPQFSAFEREYTSKVLKAL
ncbi:MAG: DUF4276 family protein [Polyangiales bacterium]